MVSSTVQAKDSAIIVFDASGSMWGKIKGKAKIKIARDVMGTLVKDWNEDIELGLIAYGHREKGNCDDIEVLLPVATVDNKKILKIINNISPMGKHQLANAKGDLVFIAKPSMDENKYYYSGGQSASTSKGSPATLTAPAKKGTYEIRYYSKGNGKVLAKRALIVR